MSSSRSDFFLYNIINFEEPNVIFNYTILLVVFIFLSMKINFTVSLLVSLMIFTVLIDYNHTDRTQNYIYNTEKNNVKFEAIGTKSDQLSKYPKIVDLLYFFQDIRKNNIDEFNQIIDLFTQFTVMYDSCKTDYDLIDSLYKNMIYIRTKILYKMNSFIFTTYSNVESNNIVLTKENTKKLLNEMLDELVLLHNKKIYYNGYNNQSSYLDTSGVLPYNNTDNPNISNRNDNPNISNLLIW